MLYRCRIREGTMGGRDPFFVFPYLLIVYDYTYSTLHQIPSSIRDRMPQFLVVITARDLLLATTAFGPPILIKPKLLIERSYHDSPLDENGLGFIYLTRRISCQLSDE